MQVVSWEDGGIPGLFGRQAAWLQEYRRSDGQVLRGIAQQQHFIRGNLPQRIIR